MNSRSFNANRAFFVPRDERLAGNQNFHDFIKERKKEGRKEGLKGEKKPLAHFRGGEEEEGIEE